MLNLNLVYDERGAFGGKLIKSKEPSEDMLGLPETK